MTIKFYSFALASLGLVASSLIAIPTTAEAPNYSIVYKSDSDRYLIELLQSNTFGVVSSDVEANYVHISFRDLDNDWDRNSLGHYLNQHHKSPTTP